MNRKKIALIFIIIAGEAIFMLPFLVPRLYRPLLLEVWQLSNLDIGTAFSAYGFSAMISYVIGGPLADKYSPRSLISSSLMITATLGLILITSPSRVTLILVYFFFGISTILLMWGALLKVTHIAGGEEKRSTAMGVLDGGRGLIAAIVSSALVLIISYLYGDINLLKDKTQVVRTIYLATIIFIYICSIVIWFSLKDFEGQSIQKRDWSFDKMKIIFQDIKIWLLGIIILSAYCGYKSIDNYSIYLVDIQKVSLVESSSFTSLLFWLRPISAFLTGVIVDRLHRKFQGSRFITLSLLLFIGGILQLLLAIELFSIFNLIFFTIILSAGLSYALRAVYFSVFGDLRVPEYLVGTTVGIVSLVGYLPDLFFGAFTGYLIDSFPGVTGYNYTFIFTSAMLFLGSMAGYWIYKKTNLSQ